MRIHVLQHVAHEHEGNIGVWAEARGHTVTRTLLRRGAPLPSAGAFDALVIMGGPMNVYDYDKCPWLYREKTYILDAIQKELPVLGICLGAQLIADVMGGRVRPNGQPEMGWFPVALTAEARFLSPFNALPDEFPAFHWHSDTFDLPPGAVRTAGSQACLNQAFVVGRRVVGLQFHLECAEADIRAMLEQEDGSEPPKGPYVQAPAEMLADPARPQALRGLLFAFLDAFPGLTSASPRDGG